MLAIPMTAKGVDIRPLRQITGKSEFNEVFLDGVEVPVENLIGPEHEGWRVTNTTLANERGASFVWKEQVLLELAMDHLTKTCASRGRLGDPLVRQRLAQSWIEVEIFRLHNARTLTRLARGERARRGVEHREAVLGGHEPAALRDRGRRRSRPTRSSCLTPTARSTAAGGRSGCSQSRANSIMGGTSEIQRNIIGERLLGLPREPKVS